MQYRIQLVDESGRVIETVRLASPDVCTHAGDEVCAEDHCVLAEVTDWSIRFVDESKEG